MDDLVGKKIRSRQLLWTILEKLDDGRFKIEATNGSKAIVDLATIEMWIEQYGVEP